MKFALTSVKLKSGEELSILKIVAPAEQYGEPLRKFYSHKPDIWFRDLEKRLIGIETGLDSWYIGELNEAIVSGIQLTYAKSKPSIGAIDHVFTVPEQRQKGIADAIMGTLIEDYKSQGGEVLLLGTGKKGAAHHLYQKHGFIDYNHHPELNGTHMRAILTAESQEEFDKRYFAPSENLKLRPITRSDLALFRQLFNSPSKRLLKNYALGIQGKLPADGLLEVAERLEEKAGIALGLEKPEGNLVGLGTVLPRGSIYEWHRGIFDLYVHPNFDSHSLKLISSVLEEIKQLENIKILVSFIETKEKATIEALKSAGFKKTGFVPKMFVDESREYEVSIYCLEI